MKRDDLLMLSAADVATLLTLDECIAAVEHAFRLHGLRTAPSPGVLSMHVAGGGFHVKAGALDLGRKYFAAKVNGNFPENRTRHDRPTIQGVIVLCDAENGAPLAVMDSREITSLRTAAATAVAAKYLARPDSRTLTVCGCGIQGRVQALAIARVCQVEEILTFDKDHERASRLAQTLTCELKIPVTPAPDLASATLRSDICVTCTTSREPLLRPDDIPPGTFIAAVGGDNPEKQEIHPKLLSNSKIVVDILEQSATIGDLHHALNTGAVTRSDVHAELGEIVAGKKAARESTKEIIVFDSTGMALQDVAAAVVVYEKAHRNGSGTRLNLAV